MSAISAKPITVDDSFHGAPWAVTRVPGLFYFQWKGIVDRLLAFLLLIPGLPVIAGLVLLIKLTSRGPGIYSQTRVGRYGCIFTMYKLRSMRIDAESTTGPVWAGIKSDPRVTPLGHCLRRLHLDELPQLLNVVRGEMSLVGPRPERPEFVRVLAEQVPDYLERLLVAPGITGLAQVNLPPDTDLDSVRRKIVLDRQYIATAGVLMDVRLVLCTLLRVVGLRGGKAVSLLGLHRRVELVAEEAPIGGVPGAAPASPQTIYQAATGDPDGSSNGPHSPKRPHRPGESRIMKAH
jgi:lipopolysaccharide/colanic/teichoic acid biosynthesis glycosyltransferase